MDQHGPGQEPLGRVWPRQHPPGPPLYDPPRHGHLPGSPTPPGVGRDPGSSQAWPEPVVHPIPGGGPGWRAALVGGVVGAVVAVLVTGLLFLLFDGQEPVTLAPGTLTPDRPNITIEGGELDIGELLAKAQPSVVTIETSGTASLRGIYGGAGSGVVISGDGLVLTNAHVVAGADAISVTLVDGSTREAELVGSNPDDDVALIQVTDVTGLEPADLGSSSALRVGDEVVAIGNALNLGGVPSVTRGIVSATDRTIEAPGVTLSNLIQTDAAINPGNSGGPLLNARGEVVGINTAIIEEAQNVGFAIAIDAVKPLIDDIRAGNATITQDTTFLGVSTLPIGGLAPEQLEELGVDADEGVVVESIVEGSAAQDAGLEVGDVLVEIAGQPVESQQDVADIVVAQRPGTEVEILYERDGRVQRTTATLTTRGEAGD